MELSNNGKILDKVIFPQITIENMDDIYNYNIYVNYLKRYNIWKKSPNSRPETEIKMMVMYLVKYKTFHEHKEE